MDEYTFKHCPKGHYYQGEECPYCKAQTSPVSRFVEKDTCAPSRMKVCPNNHGYSQSLSCCPYCGKAEIVRYINGDKTIRFRSLNIPLKKVCFVHCEGNPQEVIPEENLFKIATLKTTCLEDIRYGIRFNYAIDGAYENPFWGSNCIISIGEAHYTVKEFISWVDLLLNAEVIGIE